MKLSAARILLTIVLLVVFPLLVIIPTVRSSNPSSAVFRWQPRTDAPLERLESIGAQIGDRLYVMSGFLNTAMQIAVQVDVYDLAADRWINNVSLMPGDGVTHINPAVDGTDIWIAGGFAGDHPGPPVADVWRYDTIQNAWFAGPPLPEVRAGGSLVRLDRRLHYFGGFAFRDGPHSLDNTRTTHWVLDLDNPTAGWQTLAPLPEPLGHLSGIALHGMIYAIGGQIRHDRDPQDLASVYVYDPAQDRWDPRADLPTPRSHAEPGIFELHGRIILVGGRDNTTTTRSFILDRITMYDPASNLWLDLPPLPFNRIAPIAVTRNGEIVITQGGENWNRPQRITISSLLDANWETEHPAAPLTPGQASGAIVGRRMFVLGTPMTETLAFDLSLGEWDPTNAHPPRPLPSAGSVAEAFADKLYVFGGTGAAATALQIYDPATGIWSTGASLPFAAEHAATVRIGAAIYLVAADQAARYDPATDTWELLAAPPVPVRAAAAGSDGDWLYLFGGITATGPTDVVQLYDPDLDQWISSRDPQSPLAALPEPRAAAGRAVCIGGEFYLPGGNDRNNLPLSSGAIYRPATSSWRSFPAAPTPRTHTAVAAIADRIYVAGGITADYSAAPVIEVYNAIPPTNTIDSCALVHEPLPEPEPPPDPPTVTPPPEAPSPTPIPAPSPTDEWRQYLPMMIH